MTNVKPIPEGFSTVTPNLVVQGGAEAIEFYERAFGAEVVARLEAGGMLMHATLRIGDAVITLSDAMPAHGLVAPDADAPRLRLPHALRRGRRRLARRALDAGATRDQPGRRPRPRRPRRLAARPVRPPLGDRRRTSRTSPPRRSSSGWRSRRDGRRGDVRDHGLGRRAALRRAGRRPAARADHRPQAFSGPLRARARRSCWSAPRPATWPPSACAARSTGGRGRSSSSTAPRARPTARRSCSGTSCPAPAPASWRAARHRADGARALHAGLRAGLAAGEARTATRSGLFGAFVDGRDGDAALRRRSR